MRFSKWLCGVAICVLSCSQLLADQAFVTDFITTVYAFDTNDLNSPATAYTVPSSPDNIAFSPDGNTVYFTTYGGGDVYSFPSNNPSAVTALNTGIALPVGIAISSDGTLGFVAEDFGGTPGLFSFPTGGAVHTATLLTPTGATIPFPLFIAILGNNAFVGCINDGSVYSVTFTATTYNATLVQSFGGGRVGGIAISSDGYLYISAAFNNQILRVPVSNPTAVPTLVASPPGFTDGLAVSNDGLTVFFTSVANGVSSFPTNQGFPATITPLTNISIGRAIDIAIKPIAISPLSPPASITGKQQKNNFGLLYELFNTVNWSASPSNGVVGYNVYRNGAKVASVGAFIFSYQEHNIKGGVGTVYSVTAFDAAGNESSPITITIQ